MLFVVVVNSVKSAILNPLTDPDSQEKVLIILYKIILDVIFYITTSIFSLELILNCVAHGFLNFFR